MKTTSWSKAYAYVIGINQYQHLNPLNFCENDAKIFEENIKNIIPNIKTSLTCGNDFTYNKFKSILKDINNIENNENENNIVFFYYAGHGFSHKGKDYLICYDTDNSDEDKIENTSISTTDLIGTAYKSGIKTVIMIFDACRNFLTRTTTQPFGTFGNLTAEISRRQGIISFFSCSPGEYSQELGVLSHGIFTYALVESLKECQYCTPINLNKSIGDKVKQLVAANNLYKQIPYTTVGPIEKANLDIVAGKEITFNYNNKPKCILIAGSTHAGKSDIGRYLAQQYNFGHYEMSALAYKRYEDFKKNEHFDGTIQDFLEKELWSTNEKKDIIARELLAKYDGKNSVVISGPRLTEEIDTLLANNWDVIPLYVYTEPRIRLERYISLQKEKSFLNELSFEEFIKRDMRELNWGLAKIATLEKFKMIINNYEHEKFYEETKKYIDSVMN